MAGTSVLLGGATLIDWGTEPGTCTYVGEYVSVDAVDEPLMEFGWQTANAGSRILRPGLPVDVPLELEFSEPPVVTSPAANESYRLGEVLAWRLSEADEAHPTLQPIVTIVGGVHADAVMEIDMPAGTTSAVLPLPPSSVDAAELLGRIAVAYLQTCDYDDARWLCLRAGVPRAFGVGL